MRFDTFPPAIIALRGAPTSQQLQALSDAFKRGFPSAGYRYVLASHEKCVQPLTEFCVSLNLRLAFIHGSLPQALAVMEQYARTGVAPLPYALLHDWYLACDEKSKAQDALERGVKAQDPKAVVKRVEYVGYLFALVLWLILCAYLKCLILRREMLRAAEPDVSLATTLLQAVREDYEAGQLWRMLTTDISSVYHDSENALTFQRLRQISPAYPLRHLTMNCASSQLIPALGAATTLKSVYILSHIPNDFRTQIAVQLKAVPSLREIDLNDFPIDAGLELLQTRTNWTHIHLPEKRQDFKKAAALATHSNNGAFTLESRRCSEEFEGLALWLTNPHLTALRIPYGTVPPSVLAELSGCSNLTNLVRS